MIFLPTASRTRSWVIVLPKERQISRSPKADLASPLASFAISARLSSGIFLLIPSFSVARFRIFRIADSSRFFRTITRDLEMRAGITSKLGFSVVAPIKVISPDSTWGRKASCWALLKRWISSTNRRVRILRFQFCLARSTTASTSLLWAVTAES